MPDSITLIAYDRRGGIRIGVVVENDPCVVLVRGDDGIVEPYPRGMIRIAAEG